MTDTSDVASLSEEEFSATSMSLMDHMNLKSSIHGDLPAVEIEGMDIILLGTKFQDNPLDHVSIGTDEEEIQELTSSSSSLEPRRIHPCHKRRVCGRRNDRWQELLLGEVDSLVLAREQLPHIVHSPTKTERSTKSHHEGKGPMGESDSLELARRRLPQCIHKKLDTQSELQKDTTSKGGDGTDSESTASTTSISTQFTSETIDSLILTRMRLQRAHRPSRCTRRPRALNWITASRSAGEARKREDSNATSHFTHPPSQSSEGACAA